MHRKLWHHFSIFTYFLESPIQFVEDFTPDGHMIVTKFNACAFVKCMTQVHQKFRSSLRGTYMLVKYLFATTDETRAYIFALAILLNCEYVKGRLCFELQLKCECRYHQEGEKYDECFFNVSTICTCNKVKDWLVERLTGIVGRVIVYLQRNMVELKTRSFDAFKENVVLQNMIEVDLQKLFV